MTIDDRELEAAMATLLTSAPTSLAPGVLAEVGLADRYATIASPIGPVVVAWNGIGVSIVAAATNDATFETAHQAHSNPGILFRRKRFVVELPRFVGALVRWVGARVRTSAGTATGGCGTHVARSGGVATWWIDRRRRGASFGSNAWSAARGPRQWTSAASDLTARLGTSRSRPVRDTTSEAALAPCPSGRGIYPPVALAAGSCLKRSTRWRHPMRR